MRRASKNASVRRTNRYMSTTKNILLSILIGLVCWVVIFLINSISKSLYSISMLVILPFAGGVIICVVVKDSRKYMLILFCGIAVSTMHIMSASRALMVFYPENGIINYALDCIKIWLVFTGPLQVVFTILGCFITQAMKKSRGKKREKN